MATNMDMFTVFDKSDCLKFVDDLSQVDKSNTFLKDRNNHRFLSAQLDMCVRFRAHGGSFRGHPSLKEMAHFIAVAASPSMLGVVTPTLDGDQAKERSPVDASKFSDSISPWDGNLVK
jgi:hypothetical protein